MDDTSPTRQWFHDQIDVLNGELSHLEPDDPSRPEIRRQLLALLARLEAFEEPVSRGPSHAHGTLRTLVGSLARIAAGIMVGLLLLAGVALVALIVSPDLHERVDLPNLAGGRTDVQQPVPGPPSELDQMPAQEPDQPAVGSPIPADEDELGQIVSGDVRNMATAQENILTNTGRYADTLDELIEVGFVPSGFTTHGMSTDGRTYCVWAAHDLAPGHWWFWESSDPTIQRSTTVPC